LSDNEVATLSSEVSEQEISLALWSMKPFKSPGGDGLHAGFFQRFWLIVGNSIRGKIKKVFETERIPVGLNHTLVALIPKRPGPEILGHLRPISMCNRVYKIISKIIVHRIRPFLSNLVSPLQTAFVKGRRWLNNVIITQEILHSMKYKKGKGGWMVLKLDLKKAYDQLEWSFVREVLIHFNFPSSLFNIIMSCISSASVSILFNGGKLEPFNPSRGLRQGDPLSPYIFILCLEYLGFMIHEKVSNGV
jgi:hypothetical protein